MSAAIVLFSSFALIRSGDAWLGALYLLILLMPLSSAAYFWRKQKLNQTPKSHSTLKYGGVLFALQGAALACWAYDLATTCYAVDVARIAYELNPLGWPLGALGALVYYAPAVAFTYLLLFRFKDKTSYYAAVPMAAISLCMGAMNLYAGIGNFHFFLVTAWLPTATHYSLLALVLSVDLACLVTLAVTAKRQVTRHRNFNPMQKLP
jgi:hypothetical protein